MGQININEPVLHILPRVKLFIFIAGSQLINKAPYRLQNPFQHKRNPIQQAADYQVGSADCCLSLISSSISVTYSNFFFSS